MTKKDISDLVSLPATNKEKQEAYKKTVASVSGTAYVYDSDLLKQIKNFDDYSDEAKNELRLWAALGYLTPVEQTTPEGEVETTESTWVTALNKLANPASLKTLESMRMMTNTLVSNDRIALIEGVEPTDNALSANSEYVLASYLLHFNELKPIDVRKIIAYNYYSTTQVVNERKNNPESTQAIDSMLLYLPQNGDDRRKVIGRLNDMLVMAAYQNISGAVHQDFTQKMSVDVETLPKSTLDVVILGLANKVDVIDVLINQLSELGVTETSKVKLPAADKLQSIIDTYMASNGIEPQFATLNEVTSKILATFENDNDLFTVVHAGSLDLISQKEKEAEEREEAERQRQAEEQKQAKKQQSEEAPVENETDNETGDLLMKWAKDGFNSKQEALAELNNIAELASALQTRMDFFKEALEKTEF